MFYVKSIGRNNKNRITVCDTYDNSESVHYIPDLVPFLQNNIISISGLNYDDYDNEYKATKLTSLQAELYVENLFTVYNSINRLPIINHSLCSLEDIEQKIEAINKSKDNFVYDATFIDTHFFITCSLVQKIFPLNYRLFDKFPFDIYLCDVGNSTKKNKNCILGVVAYNLKTKKNYCVFNDYILLDSLDIHVYNDWLLVIRYKDTSDCGYEIVLGAKDDIPFWYSIQKFGFLTFMGYEKYLPKLDYKRFAINDNILQLSDEYLFNSSDCIVYSTEDIGFDFEELDSKDNYTLYRRGNKYVIKMPDGRFIDLSHRRYFRMNTTLSKISEISNTSISFLAGEYKIYHYDLTTNENRMTNRFKIYDVNNMVDTYTNQLVPLTPESLKNICSIDGDVSEIYNVEVESGVVTYSERVNNRLITYSTMSNYQINDKSLYYVDKVDDTFYLIDYVTKEKKDLDYDYIKKCIDNGIKVDGAIGLCLIGISYAKELEKKIYSKYQINILSYCMTHRKNIGDTVVEIDYPTKQFILDDKMSMSYKYSSSDVIVTISFNKFNMANISLNGSFDKNSEKYYIMNGVFYLGFNSGTNRYLYKIKDLNLQINEYMIAYQSEVIDYEGIYI